MTEKNLNLLKGGVEMRLFGGKRVEVLEDWLYAYLEKLVELMADEQLIKSRSRRSFLDKLFHGRKDNEKPEHFSPSIIMGLGDFFEDFFGDALYSFVSYDVLPEEEAVKTFRDKKVIKHFGLIGPMSPERLQATLALMLSSHEFMEYLFTVVIDPCQEDHISLATLLGLNRDLDDDEDDDDDE